MKTLRRSALTLLALTILFSMQSFADDSQPAAAPDGSSFSVAFSQGSYLGIDPQDVTAERMSALKLHEERGVEVMMVDEDAPAGRAGIREHDVILQFNNVPVQSVAQLKRLLEETPAGRTVAVGLSRDGQPLTVQVKLTNRANQTAEFPIHVEVPQVQAFETMPDMDFVETFNTATSCGLVVENLSPQLGDYFGVRSGHGVLVRSVERGSQAEASGFKAGDVIVQFSADPIRSRGDLLMALRHYRGAKVKVSVLRERRPHSLLLTVPQNSSSAPSGELFVPKDVERSIHDAMRQLPDQQAMLRDLRKQLSQEHFDEVSSRAMQQAAEALREMKHQLQNLRMFPM